MKACLSDATALLAVMALLSACGSSAPDSGSPPSPSPANPGTTTGSVTSVTGTVQGWSGGIVPVSLYTDPLHPSTGTLLADGTLQASGAFSLTLPSADTVSPSLQPLTAQKLSNAPGECSGNAAVSDGTARSFLFGGLNLNHSNTLVNLISNGTSSSDQSVFTLNLWVYADRAVTVSGSQTCTYDGQTFPAQFSGVSLQSGWNVLTRQLTFTQSKGGFSTVISRSTAPLQLWSTNH